ncbi:MAG: hypothetical protein EBZ50_00725, partial [Alphaproteobacteria bacterium]|nr:hypothetical protein [Alphaproteobacteria bacterium]
AAATPSAAAARTAERTPVLKNAGMFFAVSTTSLCHGPTCGSLDGPRFSSPPNCCIVIRGLMADRLAPPKERLLAHLSPARIVTSPRAR